MLMHVRWVFLRQTPDPEMNWKHVDFDANACEMGVFKTDPGVDVYEIYFQYACYNLVATTVATPVVTAGFPVSMPQHAGDL